MSQIVQRDIGNTSSPHRCSKSCRDVPVGLPLTVEKTGAVGAALILLAFSVSVNTMVSGCCVTLYRPYGDAVVTHIRYSGDTIWLVRRQQKIQEIVIFIEYFFDNFHDILYP
jgi:hypothetical protein